MVFLTEQTGKRRFRSPLDSSQQVSIFTHKESRALVLENIRKNVSDHSGSKETDGEDMEAYAECQTKCKGFYLFRSEKSSRRYERMLHAAQLSDAYFFLGSSESQSLNRNSPALARLSI